MGFFGKVKQATGIGLSGSEIYARAYDRGILLGDRRTAIQTFGDAATRLEKEGNTALAARARANAALYEFLERPSLPGLRALAMALGPVSEIEQIGSPSAFMPAQPLTQEIGARLAEQGIPDSPPDAALAGHQRALAALEPILDRTLLLYRIAPLPGEGPLVETARSRYFWHQGMAGYNVALLTQAADPTDAAAHAVAAAQAFQRCGDEQKRRTVDDLALRLQMRRSCWICRREMQGLGVHFDWYPTSLSSYVEGVLDRGGQDRGSIDGTRNTAVLCAPCAALIERQADRFAAVRVRELREELKPVLDAVWEAIQALESRLNGNG